MREEIAAVIWEYGQIVEPTNTKLHCLQRCQRNGVAAIVFLAFFAVATIASGQTWFVVQPYVAIGLGLVVAVAFAGERFLSERGMWRRERGGASDVTSCAGAIPDEEYARRLLAELLTKEVGPGFKCARNPNDPPDLLVTFDDGRRLGVEVTRTYLHVAALAPTGRAPQQRTCNDGRGSGRECRTRKAQCERCRLLP